MRRVPACILTFVFVALLSMQAAGLHLHVNLQGGDGGLHGAHVHHADPDGHDHGADVDVSLFELGATWSKILTFLVSVVSLPLAVVWVLQAFVPPSVTTLSTHRRSRWRPPLRAPPLAA